MKQISQTLMCAAVLSCAALHAQAAVYLTYCTDEDIRSGLTNSNTSATISAAVAYTPESYADKTYYSISAIEFGLYDVSKLSTMKLWLRHHLYDTENQQEWELDVEQLSAGWNTLQLESPIVLSEQTDTLFFGYDYTQSAKSSKVIGVSGDKTPNAIYGGANGKWKDYSSSYAPLAFRGVLRGNNPYDVALLDLTTTNRTQHVGEDKTLEPLLVHGVIENHGYESLDKVLVEWSHMGKKGSQTFDAHLPAGERMEFDFEYPVSERTDDNSVLEVNLVLPDVTDARLDDNYGKIYFERIDSDYSARARQSILLEQYTSLQNGFASEGLDHVGQAIAMIHDGNLLPQDVRLITLVQHQGYGPDDGLRVNEGNPYKAEAIFGQGGLQYAPAVSIDHRKVMSSTLPADSIAHVICQTYADNNKVYTDIDAKCALVAGKVTIDVDLNTNSIAWCDEPVMVVAIVRNEINTEGSQKDYSAYQHTEQNLIGKYLTTANGKSILSIEGGTLSAKQLEDMQMGRTCRSVLVRHHSWDYEFPAGTSPSDYHAVIYVGELTSSSQNVDAAVILEFK